MAEEQNRRRKFKTMKLVIPGLFLLILGTGNIAVGKFKSRQYQEVLLQLSDLEPSTTLINASPLRRVQIAKRSESRLYQRQTKAKNRRDFYEVVTFGGKVFASISLLFLLPAGIIHLMQYYQQQRHIRVENLHPHSLS